MSEFLGCLVQYSTCHLLTHLSSTRRSNWTFLLLLSPLGRSVHSWKTHCSLASSLTPTTTGNMQPSASKKGACAASFSSGTGPDACQENACNESLTGQISAPAYTTAINC